MGAHRVWAPAGMGDLGRQASALRSGNRRMGRAADAKAERAQAALGNDKQSRHRALDRASDLFRQLRAASAHRKGVLAAGRRELHFAAAEHTRRHEPRVHRRQGARGRSGAQAIPRDRARDDDGGQLGRPQLRPRQPEADRPRHSRPLTEGSRARHPASAAADSRHRAGTGLRSADLGQPAGP